MLTIQNSTKYFYQEHKNGRYGNKNLGWCDRKLFLAIHIFGIYDDFCSHFSGLFSIEQYKHASVEWWTNNWKL